MTFPDQLRMDHVTAALWGTGGRGASVMVGSGFSRNARPKRPSGSPMPMLEDLVAQLHRELYRHDRDHRPPPERLAQEYEVECGETKLHQVIQKMIADPDYRPGPFRGRLLKMPWRDIFTTNWDTLLEPFSNGRARRSQSAHIPSSEPEVIFRRIVVRGSSSCTDLCRTSLLFSRRSRIADTRARMHRKVLREHCAASNDGNRGSYARVFW